MRSFALLALIVFDSGCAPRTGDALVDEVVSRVAPFTSCVQVGQTRIIRDEGGNGPPAALVPSSFRDPDVRAAAEKAAVPWQTVQPGRPKIFGVGTVDRCATRVGASVRVGKFAFLTYAEPEGEIGAFAFQRQADRWRVKERVRLGYW
jgi:hypothetical protein